MEFVYKLILEDRLFQEENWTEKDEKIVSEHFNHLLQLKEQNKLILAGKTAGLDTTTYGLCIFTADSLKEATAIMNNDPAVKSGIMKATLHEYNIALFNPGYKGE